MAKDPAFLFYTSDFLTGTMFLTNEQVGIYIRLLCSQHQHGGLIEANIFESLTNGHPILVPKFIKTENGYYNERLAKEMQSRSKKSDNISKAAKDTWAKRKLENDTIVLQSYNDTNTKLTKKHRKAIRPEDVNEIEIEDYFVSNGYSKESAKKFFDYYSIASWRDSKGNPVKNWKQKAQAVWFKPENKISEQQKQKQPKALL